MASFTAGTTFVDGVSNDVTAAKLGALVTNATPTSGFIQDRTAETIIATNDTLLIGDASDSNNLKRMTVANLLKAPLVSTSGTVDNLTTGTTTSTAQIVTSGTTATFNSTTGTIANLVTTTGTIGVGTFGTTTSTAATITTGTITTGVIPTLTSTTLITTGTGTAASPAIVPTGDTNTGLFFPAADTIAFSEGGAESMRIDSSGNVGIGTVSPINKLHLYNGTASVGATQLELEGLYNGYGAGINFSSRTSSGGTLVSMAKITADAESAFNTTPSTQDSRLVFSTTLDGTLTERLRIESSGKVDASGEVEAKNFTVNVNTLSTASGTQNLDFTSEGYLTHAITGNITYTASNYSAGRSLSIRITCDGTQRNLTFPAGWVFVGSKPATIAASKVAVLSITSFGATEANTVAAYAVQT